MNVLLLINLYKIKIQKKLQTLIFIKKLTILFDM